MRLLPALLLLAMLLPGGPAAGQGPGSGARAQVIQAAYPEPMLAVLDTQEVMRRAAAAQSIAEQLDGFRERYRAEIQAAETELRQEEEALRRQRAVLTQEAFEQRRRAFEQEVLQVQRKAQDRAHSLEQAGDEALGKVEETLIEVVKEMTAQSEINLVVDKSRVMVVINAIDITDEVIAMLDERLPRVEVADPGR